MQLYVQSRPLRGVPEHSVKLGYKKEDINRANALASYIHDIFVLGDTLENTYRELKRQAIYLKAYIQYKKLFIQDLKQNIDVIMAVTPTMTALSLIALLLVIRMAGLLLNSPLNSSLLPFS